MQCVYFKDGFVYATNAYIAIKQHLSLHGFNDEEIKALDDKLLHKDHLKFMKKCDYFEILPEGIKSRKGFLSTTHQFFDDKYPDVEAVIPTIKDYQTNKFSVRANHLDLLQKVMFHNHEPFIKIQFTAPNRPLLVTSEIEVDKQVAIISPVSNHE
ncbi:MAG: hypothetical protein ACI35V_07925 [Sphingobacterium composti]